LGHDSVDFSAASEHAVEGNIDAMEALAHRAIENSEDVERAVSFVRAVAEGTN
jgi:hypothetical protein